MGNIFSGPTYIIRAVPEPEKRVRKLHGAHKKVCIVFLKQFLILNVCWKENLLISLLCSEVRTGEEEDRS